MNRRGFLQTGVAGIAALSTTRLYGKIGTSSAKKLRVALIGCGSRGCYALLPSICAERSFKAPVVDNNPLVTSSEELVALVDPDEGNLQRALNRVRQTAPSVDISKIKRYRDYREMFEKMGSQLDAVMIATPNHHHVLPALMAIRRGIHVYVEKPMAMTLSEVRLMTEEARKYGVVTQVGHQGHSTEGIRRLCEYIWAGAIGQIHEAYCWDDRVNSLTSPRPANCPVPPGLDWNLWLGPAAYRDYYPGLHPHDWHSWIDFGNGSIGNMGSHILDPVFWSLKLKNPKSVELLDTRPGIPGVWPVRNHIRWDFPAREGMDPVSVHWYDGLAGDIPMNNETVDKIGIIRKRENRNTPPVLLELEKKYKIRLGDVGSFFIGEKGILAIGHFCDGLCFVPREMKNSVPRPPKTIPRVYGSHQTDFFRACRGGAPAGANFEYGGPLAETVLLGDVVMRTGVGKKLEWDAAALRFSNAPEATRYISSTYREGWGI